MPFVDEGGPTVNPPPTVVPIQVVTTETTVGGVTATGEPLLTTQAVPIKEAIDAVSSAITVIPRATAPLVSNLPQNARPGQWFMFATQPNYAYVMCSDNVYRAIVLIPVQ
jgi:hypothetical protein